LLSGQKFDLRIEGRGTGPFSASLAIDGVPQDFTSGAQGTDQTDGISSPGYGGFNLRGYTNNAVGLHTISATFSDATGSVDVVTTFEILDLRGKQRPAKNIIILLGDGMGVAHRTAARLVKYGVNAGQPNGYLAMDRLPGTGLVTTHSLNSIVTDSAPGMACYATGNHSNNGQEGVYPANVTSPFYYPRVEYMAEYLHRTRGASLGLVTTADIEDATPAANAVHTGDRNAGTGVCDQYLDESDAEGSGRYGTGLTVLMGGGRRWFLPAGQFGSSRSASTDYANLPDDLIAAWQLPAGGSLDPSRDLIQDFVSAGYTYVATATELSTVGTPDKLLGLFGYGNMNVAMDKLAKKRGVLLPGTTSFAVDDYHAPDQPMLEKMTEAALRVLQKNTNGFVLMVEGAHIDKQSHYMDADRVIDETIEFDNAVGVATEFAEHAGDTVVVVLADHECSGFSLIGALAGGIKQLQSLPSDRDTLNPAMHPARQNLVGTYDAAAFPRYNILDDGYPETFDIDGKVLVGYGADGDRYEGWLVKPHPVIDSLLPNDIKAELSGLGYVTDPYLREESRVGFFIRGQVPGTQAVHTASDIPISAYSTGPRGRPNHWYQQFYGVQTNTDVFFKLMRAALGGD
jgi:alkaline phosphatase